MALRANIDMDINGIFSQVKCLKIIFVWFVLRPMRDTSRKARKGSWESNTEPRSGEVCCARVKGKCLCT